MPSATALRVGAEVDLVRGRLAAGPPVQLGVEADARGAVGRLGLEGLHRDVEEPHLAQAGLRRDAAPVAVDRQLDELGHDAAEIDGRVGGVGRHAGRLGELRHAFQRRPGLRRRWSTRS